jgi:hypothetical protein
MADDEKTDGTENPAKGPPVLRINAAESVARGVYSNLSLIHNNEVEFVMDFVFVEPQRPQGHVVSRVVTNPKAAKRLMIGLQELIRRYEERFGEIQLPALPIVQGNYH